MDYSKLDVNYLIDLSETLEKDLKIQVGIDFHLNKTLPSDFRILKKLAKGGYGEVYVVQKDNKIYAMKRVSKELVLRFPNATFYMNEREIMTSHSIEWLVKSYVCVQDDSFIYYLMDFIPGGDLLGYLSKINIMKEHEIRFYAAEICSAIHEIHKLGWIHRDLKPDNILIDSSGHIKIADFGSCAKLVNGIVQSSTTVGTPDYISPDVLSSIGELVSYGPEVDYWTLGVILYEMYYGSTPFYSNSLKDTYSKITNIEYEFDNTISNDLQDLIRNLLCFKEVRFNFEKIKKHRFFDGINWNDLRNQVAPFKPIINEQADISNFVDTDFAPENSVAPGGFRNFIGFTFDPDHCQRILKVLFNNLPNRFSDESKDFCEKRTCQLENPVSKEIGLVENKIKNLYLKEKEEKDVIAEYNLLKDQITMKKKILDELTAEVQSKTLEATNKDALIKNHTEEINKIMSDITEKKKQLELLNSSINENRNEFDSNRNNNNELLSENDKIQILKKLKEIKMNFEESKFEEKLNELQSDAYWIYKMNLNLLAELKNENLEESDSSLANKSIEDLKKQLRVQKTEIREYEQRIEQELHIKKKLENEIKNLKTSLRESSRRIYDLKMSCTNLLTNMETTLEIDNGMLTIDNYESTLNGVYIRDLRNNELYHLPNKKRALCIQVHFLGEKISCSASSGTRRSLKALENDLEKEMMILKGLDDLLKVLTGKTREEAELQKKGSSKKVEQLKAEIERARKSTLVENLIDDNEKVSEFNNHLFYEKTLAKGSLCDHCNEVLYGIVNQALVCKDCLLVVHKTCYVLVEESCELQRAIKSGKTIPIICRTKEEKDKILKLNKSVF